MSRKGWLSVSVQCPFGTTEPLATWRRSYVASWFLYGRMLELGYRSIFLLPRLAYLLAAEVSESFLARPA